MYMLYILTCTSLQKRHYSHLATMFHVEKRRMANERGARPRCGAGLWQLGWRLAPPGAKTLELSASGRLSRIQPAVAGHAGAGKS